MKKALVTTTINVPTLLADYCKDFVEYGYKEQVEIIVVGDLKTPKETEEYCGNLQRKYGVKTHWLGVKEQTVFTPIEYFKFLPWNCIQRRNIGLLYAYSKGAEVIYTIDDDNFLYTKNYIGMHNIDGKKKEFEAFGRASGWHNVCEHLQEKDGKKFYHRGYPFKQRHNQYANPRAKTTKGRIVVNAGLWLGDPDIDAVTRLALFPDVEACNINKIILDTKTKSPFNSQNTALHRDVIPAYCMIAGIGRYDDIVASYFVKRIADHLEDYVSFGTPGRPDVYNLKLIHLTPLLQLLLIYCETGYTPIQPPTVYDGI